MREQGLLSTKLVFIAVWSGCEVVTLSSAPL
jgi:hypothetical protein